MYKYAFLKLFIKIKNLITFYYSDIIIIYGNNSKNIHRLRLAKLLLSFSASASAYAPSSPILL